MQSKILLVDDEKDILNLLEDVLRREGFTSLRRAENGQDALAVCRAFGPDIIVLDIMLPDMDGYEVCRQIRLFSHASILFLSSKSEELDKILGLAIGGDDYITKPFSPREVVFRIKAQLRRNAYLRSGPPGGAQAQIQIGALRIDADANRVYLGEQEVQLTAREYGLLLYLAQNQNKIISKESLYEQVWGEDGFGSDNTIMVHIRHLREKIEKDAAHPKCIVTVKGLGYKLVNADGR